MLLLVSVTVLGLVVSAEPTSNASEGLVHLVDGCYIGGRGGGAAAHELGEAGQAWSIEYSMPSMS